MKLPKIITSLFIPLVLCVFLCTSCSRASPWTSELIPQSLPTSIFSEKEVKVALVLGEGGSRGAAHLGVLEVLEKENIPVDLIVGCSIGSFVGALYADQPDAQALSQKLLHLKTRQLLSFSPFSTKKGLLKDHALQQFLTLHLKSSYFEELKIPLVIATTDLLSGETVYLEGGQLVPTICASCAIPFFFQPRELYGRLLVDGVLTDPIPISAAKKYHPDLIIAVDLSGLLIDQKPKNLFQITKRSFDILKIKQSEKASQEADVVIKPQIGSNIHFLNTKYTDKVYQAGKQAAREQVETIKQKLKEKENNSRFHF